MECTFTYYEQCIENHIALRIAVETSSGIIMVFLFPHSTCQSNLFIIQSKCPCFVCPQLALCLKTRRYQACRRENRRDFDEWPVLRKRFGHQTISLPSWVAFVYRIFNSVTQQCLLHCTSNFSFICFISRVMCCWSLWFSLHHLLHWRGNCNPPSSFVDEWVSEYVSEVKSTLWLIICCRPRSQTTDLTSSICAGLQDMNLGLTGNDLLRSCILR